MGSGSAPLRRAAQLPGAVRPGAALSSGTGWLYRAGAGAAAARRRTARGSREEYSENRRHPLDLDTWFAGHYFGVREEMDKIPAIWNDKIRDVKSLEGGNGRRATSQGPWRIEGPKRQNQSKLER